MVPATIHGDIDISDEPPAAEQIRIGDIISFRDNFDDPDFYYVRHRVVGIERVGDEYHYFTKGDGCQHQDVGFRIHADIYDIIRRIVKPPPILQRFFQAISDEQVRRWDEKHRAKLA